MWLFHPIRSDGASILGRGTQCCLAWVAGFVLFVTSNLAQAVTYRVAKDGSGDFTTINAALNAVGQAENAGAGDTVIVQPGTYHERINNNLPSGSSWNSPFTLRAASKGSATIVPPPYDVANNLYTRAILVSGATRHYSIVDGFVLECKDAWDCIKITGSSTSKAHHIRIINSEVKNARNQGILANGLHLEFINLDVHHNGWNDQTHGIYFSKNNNGLIEGCTIHDNFSFGVHFWSSGRDNNNNIVRNNVTYGNGASGILIGSGVDNIAYNNIVYGNGVNFGSSGLRVGSGGPQRNVVYNNTVFGNPKGLEIRQGTDTIVRNNIIYSNGSASANYIDNGTGTIASNNLTVDPKFVDAPNLDFRLRSDSPAIDAGMSISAVTDDFAGVLRPQGGGYDIGAYEFSDSAPPTTACSLSPGSADYCNECGPCDKGVGNCMDDADCASGLQCAADVGSVYGFGATVDVCEPLAPSLANTYTMSASSPDLINPVTNLWDGCTDGKASCTTGSSSLSSFWVEFDLGEVHRLSSARLFGDANDNWRSGSWSLAYKLLPGDGWTTAVDAQNALLNDWSTAELDVFAQFVRVEVNAPAEGTATEARELEIHGAPEEPSAPTPEPTPEPPAPDPEGGESSINCVENADGSKTCSGTLSRECTEPDADGNRQCTVTGVGCAVMTGSPGLFAILLGIGALRRRRRT